MKRRKFAPAAIFLAGLLLAAVAAASVGAATDSSAKATKSTATPVPAGKVVKFNKSARSISRAGVSGFAPGASGKVAPVPANPKANVPKGKKGASLIDRGMPPKRATGAKSSSFRSAAAASFPQAPSLPIVAGGHITQGHVVNGLNAYDQSTVGGYEPTPSDNAICEGQGYILQAVNNVMQIRDVADGGSVTGAQALESFFSPALVTTGFDFLADPQCYYDPDTRHWFLTELAFDSVNLSGSAVFIGVSQGSSPVGPWNIYVLDTTFDGTTCTAAVFAPACLGDQPLLGANKNAIYISTNSFDLGPTGAFNGAQMYIIDKSALALGLSAANTVYADLGQFFSTPEGFDDCGLSFAIFCWYSVNPAKSPNSAYSTDRGGTEFALSALDWFLSVDDRVALWAMTGTSTINQVFPSIGIQYAVVGTESYGFPPLATQKNGPIPFGDTFFGPPSPGVGPIASNDDRMGSTYFIKTPTTAHMWGALNTVVSVAGCCGVLNTHAGIAYFDIRPIWAGPFLLGGSIINQGYIANFANDVVFGAVAQGPQGLGGWIAYTLTGNQYFPTAAVSKVSPTQKAQNIAIAALGQSPNDDFCEYGVCSGPRWGDYSAAMADGSLKYLSTGYIQYPNCSDVEFIFDPSCGGTRGLSINWGTLIMKLRG